MERQESQKKKKQKNNDEPYVQVHMGIFVSSIHWAPPRETSGSTTFLFFFTPNQTPTKITFYLLSSPQFSILPKIPPNIFTLM